MYTIFSITSLTLCYTTPVRRSCRQCDIPFWGIGIGVINGRRVITNYIYSTIQGGHTSAHEDCEWCTDAATRLGAAYGIVDRY